MIKLISIIISNLLFKSFITDIFIILKIICKNILCNNIKIKVNLLLKNYNTAYISTIKLLTNIDIFVECNKL